ncbi:response regulator transcription factor [Phreatobacter sp.]|uniref:response regulator transcription factor n=1 Tax=Phreatobacter sp. TaxID=1966341 RepID=UPI003F70AE22
MPAAPAANAGRYPAPSRPDVYVVDDDAAVRDALSLMLTAEGYAVTGFADGASLVEALRGHRPRCVLLDVNMPGRSGLDVLRAIREEHLDAPVCVMSGQADIPMAVDAMRHGARDFIEKPVDADRLVFAVRSAVAERLPGQAPVINPASEGVGQLTPRERDVLGQIAAGASNKEAGRNLGISPRTVEVHRARIMEKLGARNAADLVRIVLTDRRGG